MNDEEIWELARKPVTEFVESIKEMDLNVNKLVEFYLKHTKQQHSEQIEKVVEGKATISDQTEESEQESISPLACAKLQIAIVFAINACYWMYLVTNGEDPGKNEISKEIERIRLFLNRAREVEESVTGTSSSGKRPKIDKEASKRLCMNNMSLKSSWN